MTALDDSRQAGAFEITPAMVEAGVAVLETWGGVIPSFSLVVDVYNAMAEAAKLTP